MFAWRGSPAAWQEDLLHVVDARVGTFAPEELKKLNRLGDDPVVVTLTPGEGAPVRVAAAADHLAALLGPSGWQVGHD